MEFTTTTNYYRPKSDNEINYGNLLKQVMKSNISLDEKECYKFLRKKLFTVKEKADSSYNYRRYLKIGKYTFDNIYLRKDDDEITMIHPPHGYQNEYQYTDLTLLEFLDWLRKEFIKLKECDAFYKSIVKSFK